MAVQRISPEELKDKIDRGENVAILDVRTEASFDASPVMIRGAVRIRADEVADSLDRLPCADEYVTYCT